MVNSSRESLGSDETAMIPSLISGSERGSYSLQEDCGENHQNTENTHTEVAPSPPSPIGSESWQCSGSSLIYQVEEMIREGISLSTILKNICPGIHEPPEGWSDSTISAILSDVLDQPPKRVKLPQYNTFEDAIELFKEKKRILMLTGAGVSVSCGIPDFRSKNGIYARLHVDFPDLPDPTAMFDIRYFRDNPAPFYNFAKEIFPGQFEPSVSHRFIYELEKADQLLRNYTQNIDTLENQTGVTRLIECHGSFKNASCLSCESKFKGDIIKEDVMNQKVALCPSCKTGVIKPDIVFFGEDLAQEFHRQMSLDKDNVDLLVVVGSSLKVRPVSLIPFSISPDVPQILINRESLPGYTPDIELLGDCDEIIRDICIALGGSFKEMLVDYHCKVSVAKHSGPSSPPPLDLTRRSLVPQVDFKEIMDLLDKEGKERMEALEEKDETEPQAKKLKLEDYFEKRYISVQDHLPRNSYFQLAPNRAVFPGAELYYDLEYKVTTRAPIIYGDRSNGCSDLDDDSDDDLYDPYMSTGRGGSEPHRDMIFTEIPISRPSSCKPDIDLETTLNTDEFKKALEDDIDEDDI